MTGRILKSARIFCFAKVGLIIKVALILLLIIFTPCSLAADVVKLPSPLTKGQKYSDYKHQVLKRALELTIAEFGPYEIQVSQLQMKSKRVLLAMQRGDVVNVASLAANDSWDQMALPIRVPVRGGMLSYRLLLVNDDDVAKFANIDTADQLRQLTAGTQDHWTVTTLLKDDNFKHVSANNFDGMFDMLSSRRLDYIPRAIYEVFEELHELTEENSSIVVEPSVVMLTPMVSYFYVSPKEKRLAKRLTAGMKRLSDSGELKQIFADYYAQDIRYARLNERKVVELKGDYFESQLPYFSDHMLWPIDSFLAP